MIVPFFLLLAIALPVVGSLSAIKPALPFLSLRSRGMGRRIAAAPGAGKTRLAARLLIIFDMLCNLPVVAIDPNGALSNDVLDVIDRMPAWLRKRFEQRLVYINVGGQRIGQRTYVHTFPFLYTSASGTETAYTKAHRFLDVLAKTDPDQARAPVMGKSAIEDIGEKVLMVLDALGWQITEAPLLIQNPTRYQPQLLAARERAPEVAPAIDYLLGEFARMPAREKEMKTSQFLRKISPFVLDPVLRAIYGGSMPSIRPAEVVKHRQCVLLDFRNVPKAHRRLTIAWAYKYWDEYFRERGPGKHHIPICFYIDELSFLIPSGHQRHDLVADDIAELLSVTSRNNHIFVTVIHQDLQQFDPRTNELLSRLGTQILGPSSDTEGAEQMARRFFRYDKTKAKHWRKVYGSSGLPGGGSVHIDDEPVFESPQEQTIENAYKFLDLQAFHFLVGVARREGQIPTALQHVSFEALDAGAFVRVERVDLLRALLMRQGGRTVAEILAEIADRQLEDATGQETEGFQEEPDVTGPDEQGSQAAPRSRRSTSLRREPASP
jgi:hypothetical protein